MDDVGGFESMPRVEVDVRIASRAPCGPGSVASAKSRTSSPA
jgi:hypothetical protein